MESHSTYLFVTSLFHLAIMSSRFVHIVVHVQIFFFSFFFLLFFFFPSFFFLKWSFTLAGVLYSLSPILQTTLCPQKQPAASSGFGFCMCRPDFFEIYSLENGGAVVPLGHLLITCLFFKVLEQDSLGALFMEAFSTRNKHRLIKSRFYQTKVIVSLIVITDFVVRVK